MHAAEMRQANTMRAHGVAEDVFLDFVYLICHVLREECDVASFERGIAGDLHWAESNNNVPQ